MSNTRMDIHDIRKARLNELIDLAFAGNQLAFAKKTGIKAPQVNRWLSDTASDTRNITEASARKIEELCGKPRGWLDHDESATPEEIATAFSGGKESKRELLTLVARLPDSETETLLPLVRSILAKYE